jgi:hypothetical protein
MVKGILVGGDFSDLIVRQKEGAHFEIGELLIAEDEKQKVLLQVYDLKYGSQVSSQHLELMGGLHLEDQQAAVFFDPSLRNYTMAHLKALVCVKKQDGKEEIGKAKGLPAFFSTVREPKVQDLTFFQKPEHPLFLGKLRSGSRVLDFPLYINGKEAFCHHLLIAATTGRGKSNLLKCLLWDLVDESYCGILVLDPHDEYYRALSGHQSRNRIHYYSTTTSPGSISLRFNVTLLRPQHFHGAIQWTDAQSQAVTQYYREFGEHWIESILLEKEPKGKFMEGTLAVVRRRICQVLGLEAENGIVVSDGVFVPQGGLTTIDDICNQLEKGEKVIIDTSTFDSAAEILTGSIIANELLFRYKRYNMDGTISAKPVISIVLEEAPRVLGKEVLEQGPNIFSTLAREGRKFQIGLTAITQLPSLIPREILANMNTKIILGMEMKPERQAMIESASQDLSTDDRAIASLDKGEAIVTSTFVPFALPIRIPKFQDFSRPAQTVQVKAFSGVKLG